MAECRLLDFWQYRRKQILSFRFPISQCFLISGTLFIMVRRHGRSWIAWFDSPAGEIELGRQCIQSPKEQRLRSAASGSAATTVNGHEFQSEESQPEQFRFRRNLSKCNNSQCGCHLIQNFECRKQDSNPCHTLKLTPPFSHPFFTVKPLAGSSLMYRSALPEVEPLYYAFWNSFGLLL